MKQMTKISFLFCLVVPLALGSACGSSNFASGQSDRAAKEGSDKSDQGPAKDIDLSSNEKNEDLETHSDSEFGLEDCIQKKDESSKNPLSTSVFAGGTAKASGGGNNDVASVTCGDLEFKKGEGGKCHMILSPGKENADLSKIKVKANDEVVPLSKDATSENVLESGSYTISLESKVGGAYSSCSVSVTIP